MAITQAMCTLFKKDLLSVGILLASPYESRIALCTSEISVLQKCNTVHESKQCFENSNALITNSQSVAVS